MRAAQNDNAPHLNPLPPLGARRLRGNPLPQRGQEVQSSFSHYGEKVRMRGCDAGGVINPLSLKKGEGQGEGKCHKPPHLNHLPPLGRGNEEEILPRCGSGSIRQILSTERGEEKDEKAFSRVEEKSVD